MANVDRYREGHFSLGKGEVATSTTVIAIGDLLKSTSGKLLPMASSTDNLSFRGVAHRAHPSGDVFNEVTYYRPGENTIFEFTLDASTDVVIGDELAMAAGDYTKLTKTTTDAIFVAVETLAGATTIRCKMKLPETEIGDAS